MNIFYKVVTFLGMLVLIGCGGGGSPGGSSSSTISYQVKTLNTDGKQKYSIKREDSQAIFNMTKAFFAIAGGVSEYSIRSAIDQNLNASQGCSEGGRITQQILPSNNQLTMRYQQCNIGSSIIVDGAVTYVLDKTIGGDTANYSIGSNFKVTVGGESVVLNYTIKTYLTSSGIQRWDYYIHSKDLQTGEVWEAELYILKDALETYFFGVFMRNGEEYFLLDLSSGSDTHIGIFGPSEGQLYKSFVSDGGGKLTLIAKEGELSFFHVDFRYYFSYSYLGTEYYAEVADILDWVDSPYVFFSNYREPRLSIHIDGREKAFLDTKFPYYDKLISLYQNTAKLVSNFTDDDSFGRYELNVKLISKPSESHVSLDIKQTAYHGNSDINTTLSFDVEGKYHFMVTLTDGDYVVEENFYVNYYHSNLSENQLVLEGEIKDFAILNDKEHIAYTTGESPFKLTIADLELNTIASIPVPEKPSKMALSSDGKSIAISAYKKVYLVDISDFENLAILKSWDIPASLGTIEIYKDNIYVLQNEGNSSNAYHEDLYTIHISDDSHSVYPHAIRFGREAKMRVSSVLNSLYIIGTYGSTYKFNIANVPIVSDGNYSSYSIGNSGCCDGNYWFISQDQFLTDYGEILTTSNTREEDLKHAGTLESENLILGHNNRHETLFATVDVNETLGSIIVAIEERINNSDLDKNKVYKNILEEYNLETLELKATHSLQTYWKNEDGLLYRLFVKKMKILSENKVLIAYRPFLVTDHPLHTNEYFLGFTPANNMIYEIKTLE